MTGDVDVIVVGAGVSGLAAADVLVAEGKQVLILEGRGRIGGRIETMHDPAWMVPIERGAEFIHGKPPETWGIVRAGACCLYDLNDTHMLFQKGRLQKKDDFFEEVEKVLGGVERVKGADMTFEEAVGKFGGRFKAEAKRLAKSFVEGFDAADVRVVSSQWLRAAQEASDEIEGDRLFRVLGGYDRIVQFLRTGLEDARHQLELNTLVRRIEWGKDGATVHAVNGRGDVMTCRARRVVITVPVGVLQLEGNEEGRIVFEPELPAKKRAAIGGIRMGPVVKTLLRFREAFWEEQEADLHFFHVPGDLFPTWWTTLPLRSTVLTGWSGGPAAAELSGKTTDEILTLAIGSLSKVLRVSRRRLMELLEASHVCNWQTEVLSRGAYSFAAVGGAGGPAELGRPVEGVLYFAGEAAHEGMSGTVAGAIASGRRAAGQVLRGR
ncbi:MAG: flavin monoamine oxidase family protein [Phycisphaerae bacterium]